MDLRAAISSVQATGRRVAELAERYGASTVKAVMYRILDSGEAKFAERLSHVPDGRWSHRGYTEAAVPGDREVYAYQINITKRGERLIVDNHGTDPQAGSINVTYAAFSGAVLAAITQSMTADLAGAYGGVYRRIDVQPEPGLLNCADFPGAVSPSGAFTTELQLNIAVVAVAKMLACGDKLARELILGPCLPHFYGLIGGGLGPDGELFILANTNGMMGSLGAMPDRDGVDAGGHFWIPEGIAYNVEDLEAQFPVLYLYRRFLPGGADGAGRTRGGLGFEEASALWRSPAFSIQVHGNESFAKAGGLFGGNPGSRASFRVKAGTDLEDRLAGGEMPQDFDSLAGDEDPVIFKGAPVDTQPGHVWEWSSPTTPGYGDPLMRDPDAVRRDVAGGALAAGTAERVYGVVLGDDLSVDTEATASRRADSLRARLGGDEPREPVTPPSHALQVGELLHLVDGRWWCNGADLGGADESYKRRTVTRERPLREIGPEWEAQDVEMADKMVLREYLCPVTGYRIDTEIVRAGADSLHDIDLGASSEQ